MIDGNYTEEQVTKISKEVERIRECWTQYTEEKKNGRESDFHEPPAVVVGAVKIIEGFLGTEIPMMPTNGMLCTMEVYDMISIVAMMFDFGQQAAKNGVLSRSMVPCNCAKLTDEDLANLIENKNGN